VVNSSRYKPSSTEGDERAVELLREIAETARQSGVAISLYPHKGCYAERMEDVVRLARKTDRPNVGVTFTFCHFLAVDDAKNLDRVLQMARPYLTMVTINGTSGYDPQNVGRWIQVLGEGTFDVGAVLKGLRKVDYRGPIGIIAYGIKGDRRDILSRSIQAWKKLSAQAAAQQ
jgi:sugar phosphate isomerase/epimerase